MEEQSHTLIAMLRRHPSFNAFTLEKRETIAYMASIFEDSADLAIYLSPKELVTTFQRGTTAQWQEFLNLEPVRQFIKAQIGHAAEVASRKTLQSLAQSAVKGDVSAAKQVNELAGIFSGADSNKIIVLHRVKRTHE